MHHQSMRNWKAHITVLVFGALVLGVFGKQKEKSTPVACSISVMLLGSIGFQMLMFYLVNHSDDDIKRYSWQVISSTISIFCSVLIFQGFNGVVEEYVMDGLTGEQQVMVDMCQLVVWLCAMQLSIGLSAGALSSTREGGLEERELNIKSYAVLFSHTTGFASINAWGSVQQTYLNSGPMHALLAVPIGYMGLWIMFKGFQLLRYWKSSADDGQVDEYEEKWNEETEDAENDVAGLSLSFIVVQALRFHISGDLPNQEGIEPWAQEINHSLAECVTLLMWGIGFGVGPIVILNFREKCLPETMPKTLDRILGIVNNWVTFGNAWCWFYSSKWALAALHFTNENALLHVADALALSAISFIFIFVLDKVQDNKLLGDNAESAEEAIDLIIIGLGILIGFSWEQCFDVAVDVISEHFEDQMPPCLSKLIMSFILVMIVFPAWRIHILRTYCELVEQNEGSEKMKLKSLADQHFELFCDRDTHERDLDLAHLKLKQKRRVLHNLPTHVPDQCTHHLQITSHGISEILSLPPPPGSKKKRGHHSGVKESLLDH